MIKGLFTLALTTFACCSSMAQSLNTFQKSEPNIDFLISHPPKKAIKVPHVNPNLKKHADLLLSADPKVRITQGKKSYDFLIGHAKMGNAYASLATGMYMVLDQDKQGLDMETGLLLMNQAVQQNHAGAKYALALIYIGRSMEVSQTINPDLPNLSNVVLKDADQFKNLGYEYLLDLASQGHEGAYMASCNMLITGNYLNQSLYKASLCYNNAVNLFNSPTAKSILARIYFDSPEFDSPEFELKGIQLAQEASLSGDTYAMAILGKQMIYPKHLAYSDAVKGTKLIMASAYHGDSTGIKYRDQLFNDKGALIQQPTKPQKN